MRRYKNWAHKIGSWKYLTIWRPVLPIFPRALSASFLLSTLNSFQGVLKVSSCSGSWFDSCRGRWQVPICGWHSPLLSAHPSLIVLQRLPLHLKSTNSWLLDPGHSSSNFSFLTCNNGRNRWQWESTLYLPQISSFHPPKKPVRRKLLLSSFCRWGHWVTRR